MGQVSRTKVVIQKLLSRHTYTDTHSQNECSTRNTKVVSNHGINGLKQKTTYAKMWLTAGIQNISNLDEADLRMAVLHTCPMTAASQHCHWDASSCQADTSCLDCQDLGTLRVEASYAVVPDDHLHIKPTLVITNHTWHSVVSTDNACNINIL